MTEIGLQLAFMNLVAVAIINEIYFPYPKHFNNQYWLTHCVIQPKDPSLNYKTLDINILFNI